MAVKQDNTETNDAPATAGNNVGGTSTSNGVKLNATSAGGVAKKINAGSGVGGGGVGNGSNDLTDQGNCKSINKPTKATLNGDNCNNSNSGSKSEMEKLLSLIDALEQRHMTKKFSYYPQMTPVYERIIYDLSRVPMRQSPEDVKRVKDDIAKVGAYLAKPNDKRMYLFYLRIVCKLITETAPDTPSCAIAVVFQLFDSEQIIVAVQELLSINIPDASIRKTVALLCDWVRFSNVCQNLNLWIMAIINGVQEQGKYSLLDELSLENIERLFALMILPALRTKVAPIVFKMLTTIHQTPEIFLKIVPKIPFIMRVLKQQSISVGIDDFAGDTRICIQKLVDITSALMFRFYQYDTLYSAVEVVFKDYQPSYNYLKITNGDKNDDEDLNYLLQNKSNARVGLVNLGNTCYMNSVLQALAMTKEFSRELLLIENVSPLLLKMQQQIALMHYSARFELTPTRVLNATRPPGFAPGYQQDSSEFLGYLLDTLHEQEVAYQPKHKNNVVRGDVDSGCSTTRSPDGAAAVVINDVSGNVIPYGNTNSRNISASIMQTPPNTPTKGTNNHALRTQSRVPSTIEKTFTGELATTHKCLTCGWQSRNIVSFRDLQLSFPEAKNDCSASNHSVQDLLDYYCSPEKLDGENQYKCDQCKKLTDAERFISVITAPKNLILTLKHFKYDQKCHMRAKLMHKVFHDEKVTVKVCGSDTPDEIVQYDLYAGVVHSGISMDSGHYYTYAADESNNWFKFNDNIVTQSNSEELNNLTSPNTPYILFYQMSARSNETSEAAASAKVVKIDVPVPLTLDQLPHQLRDYINNDNGRFSEELKMQRFKQLSAKRSNDTYDSNNRYDNNNDDDDQSPPPSSNGCGTNSMNININRFVY